MSRKTYIILQLKWGRCRKEHPSFPEASQLPHIQICHSSQRAETIGAPQFQGREEVRKLSSYSEAHHSCPDPLAEWKVYAGFTKGLQHEAYCHWDSKDPCCSKSVLYLRGMTKPHFGKQYTWVDRHPEETSASATYMVVELPGRFWCHQFHFRPYPHTNNIHC